MKVVKPIIITAAMLVSSTATETNAEYVAATAYALNARVTLASTGRTYECIKDPSTGNPPASSPLYWFDRGPSNKLAMFDDKLNTQTSAIGLLTTVIKPGYANSLPLFGLEGSTATVTARNGVAGELVYSKVKSLDGSVITSLFEYLYEPFVQLTEMVLTDLPTYGDLHITTTITGPATVKCGFLSAGMVYDLGETNYGVTIDIIDYSRKDTTAAGVTSLIVGAFSQRLSALVTVDNQRFAKVVRLLETLRATPCAWIGTSVTGFEPLSVFGFYRSAPLTVDNHRNSSLNLDVEGLVSWQ